MLLSLLAASLAESANLNVLQAATCEEMEALAAQCIPDVLIYDMAAASKSDLLSLLFLIPRMLLIGLDVETNRAVLIAGKETRSLTLERVKDLILSY